ncbi:MAG TPA: diguanylate cyclase [Pyrinomonadaceae bacterium]|nr:diguanylate cyclase [Pyrinomonadaceae bacterium]
MPKGIWKKAALLATCAVLSGLVLLFSLLWLSPAARGEGLSTYGLVILAVAAGMSALAYSLRRQNESRLEELRRDGEEQLRQARALADLHMSTIESLAMAIDAKDQTTHGHVRRTKLYAVELGKLLGVSAAELEALKAGALLHDIGKLAVPEYILNKPGKLTAAEFERMKVHTVVGGDIIRRVNFPCPVEDIIRHHHEKWDGTGYPSGLRGEQIPLVARVLAVVDFYDSTRCDRPYRAGMRREDSLAQLRRMSGSSFDPRVVEVFIENIDRLDALIAPQDRQEQVQEEGRAEIAASAHEAELSQDSSNQHDHASGFRSISEAQREVFALHEIARTIGASLNLSDTATLVTSKLRSITPFDTCIIYVVDELTGKAHAAHVAGAHAEFYAHRRVAFGEGITGWVVANGRSMCSVSPELDLVGVPEEIASQVGSVLAAPLLREEGAFGAITLYAGSHAPYTNEHARLLESVALHASSALNNALMFEKTKERALTDPLTELPNARALHLMLEQRVAECQRANREPLAVLSLDVDDFKEINKKYGHGVGDRLLASVAHQIKKQLRQMDVLARYSADEFIAVMPTATPEVAVLVIERVRAAVESHQYRVRTGHTTQVGISIGVGCFPRDGETAEELQRAAAADMQRDKRARKASPLPSNPDPVVSLDAYR